MIKLNLILLSALISAAVFFLPTTSFSVTDPCPPFYLRTDSGQIIDPVSGKNADQPYSTRKTCGACHDVEKISKGYHFNMDWDKASDDLFKGTKTPWLVSTGLTGSMTTYGYYFLAKKENCHPDEIDLTCFDFLARAPEKFKGFQKPGCAACHPGGGMLEFDRDGFRYDKRLAQSPELAQTLDGDYYKSKWDKTGVIEPDCFLCHSNRYHIQTRIVQMKSLNFKWAGLAAAGVGQVYGKVIDGQIPKVVYNKRLFNEDGKFVLPDMVFRPKAKNCLLCHESIELGKRGNSWDDSLNPDVHHLAGLTCIDCHTSDISHNFAKGSAMANSVADELDNTMRSCRDCHSTGYKGATRMKHEIIKKDHLDKLSCEACHIPELNRSAVGAMYVNTGRFGKIGQLDTSRFGENKTWKPAYVIRQKDKDKIARITPVNPYYASLFTNRGNDEIYVPLFLSEVETAYKQCNEQMTKRKVPYDFHGSRDILLMLATLKKTLSKNKRFKKINPHFHNGGTVYHLDKKLFLLKTEDTTWVSKIPYFSISHNVAPIEKALGSNGCKDCHSGTSHIFNGKVVTNFFGDNGQPVTVSMAQFMNLPDSSQKWNSFFSIYLKLAVPFFLTVCCVILLITAFKFYSGNESKISIIGFPAILILFSIGHILLTKDIGLLNILSRNILNSGSKIGIMFLIMSATGFIFFVKSKIKNRSLLFGFLLTGFFTATTGFILWLMPIKIGYLLLIVSTIHYLLALIFVCIVAFLCFTVYYTYD